MALTDYSNLFPNYWGASTYGAAPAPMTGRGVYGMVPGVTALPSPATDVSAVYPGLTTTTKTAADAIQAQLMGELSPETTNAIWNDAARFGVQSGMPGMVGGTLASNRYMGNIIGAREKQVQQGMQNYLSALPTIARTLTVSPESQIALSQANAVLRSAPDPTAAGTYAERLFLQALQASQNKSRSPAGGTGGYGGGTSYTGGSAFDYDPRTYRSGLPPVTYEDENIMSGAINAAPWMSADFQDQFGGGRNDFDYFNYWMGLPDEDMERYVGASPEPEFSAESLQDWYPDYGTEYYDEYAY